MCLQKNIWRLLWEDGVTLHIPAKFQFELSQPLSEAPRSLHFPSDGARCRDDCAGSGLGSSSGKDLIKCGLFLGYSSCADCSESPARSEACGHESCIVTFRQGGSASGAGPPPRPGCRRRWEKPQSPQASFPGTRLAQLHSAWSWS